MAIISPRSVGCFCIYFLLVFASVPALALEGGGPSSFCYDGVDNDIDGDVDCADTECANAFCFDSFSCTQGTTCDPVNLTCGTPNHGMCDNGLWCDGRESCEPDHPTANSFTGCRTRLDKCTTPGEACDEANDACVEIDCTDVADNDSDGFTDCNDTDCACDPGAQCVALQCQETDCTDGLDNDHDTFTDCWDPDCAGQPCKDHWDCTVDVGSTCGPPGQCSMGIPDNNYCRDMFWCNGDETCNPAPLDPPGSGCQAGADQCPLAGAACDEVNDVCVEVDCRDSTDNDLDLFVDCADSDCPCLPGASCAGTTCVEDVCNDGIDNDQDGLTDCADLVDCIVGKVCSDGYTCTDDSLTFCALGVCTGSTPDDTQCDDLIWCNGKETCTPGTPLSNPVTGCRNPPDRCITPPGQACDEVNRVCIETDCFDGVNNDSNQGRDCVDPDCSCPPGSHCNAALSRCVEDICNDGIDNDQDGLIDCADSGCHGAPCDDGIFCTDDSTAACNFPTASCDGATPMNSLCDDGLWCTNRETCEPAHPSANAQGCRIRDPRCMTPGEACDELHDVCIEIACTDGINNDSNQGRDCLDPDCPCPLGSHCNTALARCVEDFCDDGIDNDLDGLTDCKDPNCLGDPCDDGFSCTTGGTCDAAGDCTGGTPSHAFCDDGFWCNGDERCNPAAGDADPVTGCRHRNVPCTGPGMGCNEILDVCTEIACADHVDNDSDGFVDCVDVDCPCQTGTECNPTPGSEGCEESLCNDGVDNDGDGLTDCADPNCNFKLCSDGYACTTGETCDGSGNCSGGVPDHTICDDGLFCNGPERCRPWKLEADANGCVHTNPACPWPGSGCDEVNDVCIEVHCSDGNDNDQDLLVDCADPDCANAAPEICDDGIDNDCNGFIDCDDVLVCGPDNDGDGHREIPCGGDCDDSDPNIHPARLEDCYSPPDDDCDGRINCTDTDCQIDADGDGQWALPCGEDCDDNDPNNWFGNVEDCHDGQDNDCDFLADCADPDCIGETCDDGAACTLNDMCRGGLCIGTPDDALCDDGLWCNGEETCDPLAPGAGPGGCVDGPDPCLPPQVCNEDLDICEGGCTPDAFEPDDQCVQARPIVVTDAPQNESHTLCPEGDMDRVIFDVVQGEEYALYTTGGLDTRGTLTRDDCQSPLAFSNDCTPGDANFCIRWVAGYTGRAVLTVDSGVVAFTTSKPLPGGLEQPAVEGLRGDAVQGEAREAGAVAPVEAQAAQTGPYTLWYQRVGAGCVPDVFEPEDNVCATATLIEPTTTPAWQQHSICPPGDVDRFRFMGQAGVTYTFHTTGGTDTKAKLRDANCGALLAGSDDCGGDPNFCLSYTPADTAFYTLMVRGQDNNVVGDYVFHYKAEGGTGCTPDLQEPDDECHQANFLSVGPAEQVVLGSVCPEGDVDTFRFFAEAGTIYTFETSGTTDVRGLIGSDDCGATYADESSCAGDDVNFCIHWEPPVTGNYKLRVQGRHAGVTGDYVLRYRRSDCPPDGWEPDDRCGQGTALEIDFSLKRQAHTICPGREIDMFEFFAQKGATYVFFTEGMTDTAGAVVPADCSKYLLKNESCDGTDENFCLRWTASQAGAYKLGITGDASGGPYDLFYQQASDPGLGCTEDGSEPDDVCAQATGITPGTTVKTHAGSLCPPDDRDHFGFEAEAGATYEFWTTGATDTVGTIRGSGCGKIKGNDDCNLPDDLNFCLRWTAPQDGVYFVRVKGFSRNQTVGDYVLNYRVLP